MLKLQPTLCAFASLRDIILFKPPRDRPPHATISSILSSKNENQMKVSISLPEELVTYIDEKVKNRSQLIESLLQQWRKKQQEQEMVEACMLLDEMNLEWNDEWEQAAITDWEASG